jgi:peptidoglycan/xylan/chitin deacetylase (PgdA/CDA1 family)
MNYNIPILAYHKVDPRKELGITSISPEKFKKQVCLLKQVGYKSISPQTLFEQTDIAIKPILITFDDGYEGIYKYVHPILKEYGFTATVFLTTGYVGSYNLWDASPGPRFKHLNWKQIREMSDYGICFGSHGVNHVFLTRQSKEKVKYELENSKKILEDETGKPVRFFSYPYGDSNRRITEFVRSAGYDSAFSLRPAFLEAGDIADNRYLLPRIAVYCIDSMYDFKSKIGYSKNNTLPYVQKLKNHLINRCSYAAMVVNGLKIKRT